MKKITAFLAAAAAATLSLSSCDKEMSEDIPSSDNITVDITVGDFDGVETKSVKSGWKSGDKLNIWFDGAYWNQLPQLVLTYDGSLLNASGNFIVIYEESNSHFTSTQNSKTFTFRFGLGYTLGRVFGYSKAIAKSIACETDMQNGGLAVTLARNNFPGYMPMICLPSVFCSIMQSAIGGVLASIWRITSNPSCEED